MKGVRIRKTYTQKIGLRRQREPTQTRSGYVNANTLMNGINLTRKGANTDLGKMIIKDAVDFIPSAYNSLKN